MIFEEEGLDLHCIRYPLTIPRHSIDGRQKLSRIAHKLTHCRKLRYSRAAQADRLGRRQYQIGGRAKTAPR